MMVRGKAERKIKSSKERKQRQDQRGGAEKSTSIKERRVK